MLWEKGQKNELLQRLSNSGFGNNEVFYRVAQAISESLAKITPDSKEKKLIDAFVGGKERLKQEVLRTKPKTQQGKLDF